MVTDPSGLVHAFWAQPMFESGRSLIFYSKFDGESWTEPNDIYASWPGTPIESLAVAIDSDSSIHMVWTEGRTGPTFYGNAPLEEAAYATSWSRPMEIGFAAKEVELAIDAAGMFHLVYLVADGSEPGIYYSLSENRGRLWSYREQIDVDRPTMAIPDKLDLALDQDLGLHIVWSYYDESSGTRLGRWVRYSNKLSSQDPWSLPTTMDLAGFEEEFVHIPQPGIAVTGSTIHVIWGATHVRESGEATVNRFHTISTDRGRTWQDAMPVFGSLVGQALGDGLAVDAEGRVHFASQLRWPQGIYYSVWNGTSWSEPAIIYLIREDSNAEFRDRIHAHSVRLAIFAGQYPIVTFTSSPEDPQVILYAMNDLGSVTSSSLNPTGTDVGEPTERTPQEAIVPTSTPSGSSTLTPALNMFQASDVEPGPSVDPLLLGVIPVALLISALIVGHARRRR